jgi:hypothetical protein
MNINNWLTLVNLYLSFSHGPHRRIQNDSLSVLVPVVEDRRITLNGRF